MNPLPALMLVLIFVSASLVAFLVFRQFAAGRTAERLDAVRDPALAADAAGWVRSVQRLSGPFARLSLPRGDWADSPIRQRLMHAGFRGEQAPILYFAARTVLALGLPLLTLLAVQASARHLPGAMAMSLLFVAACCGYLLPGLLLARLATRRQREIFESFPDAADLMLVCVEAGLGLDSALNRVAEEIALKSRVVAEELQLVNLEMRAGSPRAQALRQLALRTGVEEVNAFATMLVQADRFGTSIGDALRVFADELRTRRRLRAEELAAKIPLKLLFPLIFLIFPSLLLVLLGPAFIQVYRVLLPTLGGR